MLCVARTVSAGEISGLAKTTRSQQQVPLSLRALDLLDGASASIASGLDALDAERDRARRGHPEDV